MLRELEIETKNFGLHTMNRLRNKDQIHKKVLKLQLHVKKDIEQKTKIQILKALCITEIGN